jgi:hemoglobin
VNEEGTTRTEPGGQVDAAGTAATFYDAVGGMPVFEKIVGRFYEGVAQDDLLAPMYRSDDLADGSAARRLTLFLAQYWGGPTTYSQERGHPRLRMRHAPFAVTPDARDRWLHHFRAGLDEAGLDPEDDAKFWEYVTYAAQFMVNTLDVPG